MAKDKDKREFQHDSLEDNTSIAEYLDAIRTGFAEQALQFRDDDSEIVLEPRGLVEFEVRAQQRNGRSRLTLSFSWRDRPRGRDKGNGPLRINKEEGDADE